MDSSGPSQPPVNAAYKTEGNAATSNPSEQRAAHDHSHGQPVEERLPEAPASGSREAGAWALGRGIRGAPAGEEQFGRTEEDVGRHRELDGDQMRMPGEGAVADAVERKPGASGSQPDLASDLDRKKREQADARNAIKEARKHGMVSDGGAGGGVDTEQDKMF